MGHLILLGKNWVKIRKQRLTQNIEKRNYDIRIHLDEGSDKGLAMGSFSAVQSEWQVEGRTSAVSRHSIKEKIRPFTTIYPMRKGGGGKVGQYVSKGDRALIHRGSLRIGCLK